MKAGAVGAMEINLPKFRITYWNNLSQEEEMCFCDITSLSRMAVISQLCFINIFQNIALFLCKSSAATGLP